MNKESHLHHVRKFKSSDFFQQLRRESQERIQMLILRFCPIRIERYIYCYMGTYRGTFAHILSFSNLYILLFGLSRQEEERKERERLRQEWVDMQDKIKSELFKMFLPHFDHSKYESERNSGTTAV